MRYWLRWLAVLPAAILARILVEFPLHWVLYANLTGSGFITPYPETPERLLAPFVGAIAFVWAGAKVAPAYPVHTACVLSGLWLLAVMTLSAMAFAGAEIAGVQLGFDGVLSVVRPVMSFIGAIVGFNIVRKEHAQDTKWFEKRSDGLGEESYGRQTT
jgi:hypothetical protein